MNFARCECSNSFESNAAVCFNGLLQFASLIRRKAAHAAHARDLSRVERVAQRPPAPSKPLSSPSTGDNSEAKEETGGREDEEVQLREGAFGVRAGGAA